MEVDNSYHMNELVAEKKEFLHKKLPDHSINFDKGLLRDGTVLRYRGFIVTNKGKKIDEVLLNPDN